MTIHRPKWFSSDYVMVSTAPTCGLTKGGRLLRKVDETARPVQVLDPETGALVDAINDRLLEDMELLPLLRMSRPRYMTPNCPKPLISFRPLM